MAIVKSLLRVLEEYGSEISQNKGSITVSFAKDNLSRDEDLAYVTLIVSGLKIMFCLSDESDEVPLDILSEDETESVFHSAYLFDYPDDQYNFERFKLDLRKVLDGEWTFNDLKAAQDDYLENLR